MKGFFEWLLFIFVLFFLCAIVGFYIETGTQFSGEIAFGFFCAVFVGSIFVGIFRSNLER